MSGLDTVLALSSIILTVELVQLGVMVRNWKRSYDNEQRQRQIMASLDIEPGDTPDWDIEATDD